MSEVARRSSRLLGRLAVDACTAAIADAGLTVADIDGVSCYPNPSRPVFGDDVDGVDIAGLDYVPRAVGLTGLRWSCSVDRGTVAAAIAEAVNALTVGACDYVLVWRGMHNPPGRYGRVGHEGVSGEAQFTVPWGFGHTVVQQALLCSRYTAKYGANRDHMADYIVPNRLNASTNPDAVFFGRPITRDDYLGAKMIAEPLSILDCDMAVDGCGAIVLTTADRAADLPHRPAHVTGAASLGVPMRRTLVPTLEDSMNTARTLASALWKDSGMSAGDVTHVHLHDAFSWYVCLWLEAFGFFPEGSPSAHSPMRLCRVTVNCRSTRAAARWVPVACTGCRT